MKETLSTLNNILDNGLNDGGISAPPTGGNITNIADYFIAHLNVVKQCSSNSTTEGCWDSTTQGNYDIANSPGVILANGTSIVGLFNCCNWGDGTADLRLIIDINSVNGPNTFGQDQIQVAAVFGSKNESQEWKRGMIVSNPCCNSDTGSDTLMSTLW